jgi:hypothetical protein
LLILIGDVMFSMIFRHSTLWSSSLNVYTCISS